MNVIRDTSTVPTEGWLYPGVNGFTIYTRNYGLLYGLVVEHYRANGQEPPTEQAVTDWQCEHLYLACYDSSTKEALINRFVKGLAPKPRGCGGCSG